MTEKNIARSINKHSVKPIVALALFIVILKIMNDYLFEGDPISPTLIIIFSIGGCMYIFQKVLVDLLVTSQESLSTKE